MAQRELQVPWQVPALGALLILIALAWTAAGALGFRTCDVTTVRVSSAATALHTVQTTGNSTKAETTRTTSCQTPRVTGGLPLIALVAGAVLLVPTIGAFVPEGTSIELPGGVKMSKGYKQSELAKKVLAATEEAVRSEDV
jgi:hypothetical protein